MIMIINKFIALLPNPRQEVFHARRMALLTAVALDRTPHFDAAGRFIHACSQCGREAILGTGVNLRARQLGTWYRGACKPQSSP